MEYSQSDAINSLNNIINDHFKEYSVIKILEAGCGASTHLKPSNKYQITGIDISQKQLNHNLNILEKICGDIQYYKFDIHSFDAIVSWYVLEHVKFPKKAMNNFINALKPNGLILLALPNIWSVRGLATKFTPTWAHIWYYKHILKKNNAGQNDTGPFKTYHRLTISPNNMKKLALRNNFEILFFKFIIDKNQYKKAKSNVFILLIQELFSLAINLFSLGIIKKKDYYIIVLKKNYK